MSSPRSAIVIGAGVGGLTAALALRHAGIDARVYERAPELALVHRGGGLHLWPNAMRALRQIGADRAVAEAGAPIEHVWFRNQNGKLLWKVESGQFARELDSYAVNVARADLQGALVRQLGDEHIELGHVFESFRNDADGVTATFADGTERRADVLVGADGLLSTVRRQIHGDGPPKYAGYFGWATIVETDDDHIERNALNLFFGRGSRFVYCQVGPNRYAFVASINGPETAITDPTMDKTVMARAFADYPAPVPQLVAAADETKMGRTGMYDRPPDKTWGVSRVTLLGDAAHPMTPNVAQGACQAIEDGVALAKALKSAESIDDGLRSYQEVRKKRTAPFQRQAHFVGAVLMWSNPVVCAVRDTVIKMGAPLAIRGEHKAISYEV